MKRSTKSFAKKASSLYQSIRQQLSVYAGAAAVIVSLFALAQPSEAKIFYTPVSIHIEPNQNYNLDLNHDGITDFTILNYSGGTGCYAFAYLGSSSISVQGHELDHLMTKPCPTN